MNALFSVIVYTPEEIKTVTKHYQVFNLKHVVCDQSKPRQSAKNKPYQPAKKKPRQQAKNSIGKFALTLTHCFFKGFIVLVHTVCLYFF